MQRSDRKTNRKGVIYLITIIFEDSTINERCIGTYNDALIKVKEIIEEGYIKNPEKIIAINIIKQAEL